MFCDSTAFRVTAFIFIIVTALMAVIKPAIFYGPDGQLKVFGFEYSETITPLPFSVFIYSFLVAFYMLMLFIDSRVGALMAPLK